MSWLWADPATPAAVALVLAPGDAGGGAAAPGPRPDKGGLTMDAPMGEALESYNADYANR